MGLAWLDRKHARRGWIVLLIVGGAVFGFIGVDYDFLGVTDEAFVLDDATWMLESGNLPGTWSDIKRSATFQRMVERAPEIYPRFEVAMRNTTGIRWTPARCNLWFGRIVYVFGVEDNTVASVRATLLTRTAFAAVRLAGLVETHDGVSMIFGLPVARSGEFLLIGTTPEAVVHFAETGRHISSVGGKGISFGLDADSGTGIYVGAEDELITTLWLGEIEHRAPEHQEYFAIDWPEEPMVSVVTRGVDPNTLVPEDDWPEFPGSEELARTWKDFEKMLPEGWRAGADTMQFALFDVDTSDEIPVPDAVVFSRSETPLQPLVPPRNAIPFEWSGNAGWMTPWLGEGANLFVAADERSRVFTNQEATMAKIMARRRAGRIAKDDARIEIDAERLAGVLINLVRKVAKNELVPERNADDVERDVIPWFNAFGALGRIQLEGTYDGHGIKLVGGTHAPVVENAS